MSEISINGTDYLIGRLNARQQLNVAKRLAPVIQGLLPIWAMMQTTEEPYSEQQLAISAVAAVTNTINALSDEASDYVLDMCLGVVRFRSPGGGWAPLRAPNGSGQMMLEEADNLPMVMRLLWEVIRSNVENFTLETLLPPSLMPNLPRTGSPSLQ
jgi:hypothetical protein